jgi:hypothetical protein
MFTKAFFEVPSLLEEVVELFVFSAFLLHAERENKRQIIANVPPIRLDFFTKIKTFSSTRGKYSRALPILMQRVEFLLPYFLH